MFDDYTLYDSQGVRDIVDIITTVGEYTPVVGTIMDGAEFIEDPSLLNGVAFGVGALSDALTFGAGKPITKAATKLISKSAKATKAVKNVKRAIKRVPVPKTSPKFDKHATKISKMLLDIELNAVFNSMQNEKRNEKKEAEKKKANLKRNRVVEPQDNTRVVKK